MNSQMNYYQRSVQFWSVLVMAARTQQVLSYEMLWEMTGIPARGQADILGNILFYCQQKKLPLLTSIVLKLDTGRPADPFFNTPPFDLAAEHRRVFIFNWPGHGCPTPDAFEEARTREEETVNA
jgi:hypothetical protein